MQPASGAGGGDSSPERRRAAPHPNSIPCPLPVLLELDEGQEATQSQRTPSLVASARATSFDTCLLPVPHRSLPRASRSGQLLQGLSSKWVPHVHVHARPQ